jgi:hypothetical protein
VSRVCAFSRAHLRLAPGRYRIARENAHTLDTLGHLVVPTAPGDACLRIEPD